MSRCPRIVTVCLPVCVSVAVQNERDRISVRRASYDDLAQSAALSVGTLHNAELLSRQVSLISQPLHSVSVSLYLYSVPLVFHCAGNKCAELEGNRQ